jgi:thioredoxin-related protein
MLKVLLLLFYFGTIEKSKTKKKNQVNQVNQDFRTINLNGVKIQNIGPSKRIFFRF